MAVLFLAGAVPGAGQALFPTPGRVHGVVRDDSGLALPGVTMTSIF